MKVLHQSISINGKIKLPQSLIDADSESTLALIFAPIECFDNPTLLKEIASLLPMSQIAGCSTSGDIWDQSVSNNKIDITLIQFAKTRIRIHYQPLIETEHSAKAGFDLSQSLDESDLQSLIILSEGLKSNGSKLASGIRSVINRPSVSIIGGLAGDGTAFEKTLIFDGNQVHDNGLIGIGLYGDSLKCRTSFAQGWDNFGVERMITKSKGNRLFELDNRPALDLYKAYLGSRAQELPASGLFFPLQVQINPDSEERYVRTVLGVDEKDNSIVFAGDMPEGCMARLMKTNKERVINASYEAAEEIVKDIYSLEKCAKPQQFIDDSLTIAVSCVGRKLVLGERIDEEVSAIRQALGRKAKVVGFYSFGELISKNGDMKLCNLHNQSLTLMNLHEVIETEAA